LALSQFETAFAAAVGPAEKLELISLYACARVSRF